MGVVVDTGFLFSLVALRDARHDLARVTFESLDWNELAPVLAPSTVVEETFTLANIRTKAHVLVLQRLEELFWGDYAFIRIVPVDVNEIKAISLLMRRLSEPGRLFSFVDASIVHVARERSINEIVTFDAHFDGLLVNLATRRA